MMKGKLNIFSGKKHDKAALGTEAVSEAIGTILMLAVATILVGVVALYVATLPEPDDDTHVDLTVELVYDDVAGTDVIAIRHTGGETLFEDEITIRIKVNDVDIVGSPFDFSDCDNSLGAWNGDDYWEVGETWSITQNPAISDTGDVDILVIREYQSTSKVIMRTSISQTVGGHAMADLAISGMWVMDWESNGHIIDEREPIYMNISHLGDAGTDVAFSDISLKIFDGEIYMGTPTLLVGSDIVGDNDNILEPGETAVAELNLSLEPWDGWLYTGRHTINGKIIPLDEEKEYSNNYYSLTTDVLNTPPDFRFNGPDPAIDASGVQVSNANPQNGETIQVFVTVRNVGDADVTWDMDVLLVVSLLSIDRITGTEFYEWYDDSGALGTRNGDVTDEAFDPYTCKLSGIAIPSSGEVTYTFPLTVTSSKPGESLIISAAVDAYNNASNPQSIGYTEGDNEKDNKAQKTIQVMPTVLLVDDDGKDPGQVGDVAALVRESLIGAGISPKDYFTTATIGGTDAPTYDTATTPPSPEMQDYDIIIWVTGREDSGAILTNTNVIEIQKALDNGKFVWIIGNGLCEALYGQSNFGFTPVSAITTNGNFLRNYLGIRQYRTNTVPANDFEVIDAVTYNPAGQALDGWKSGEDNYELDYVGTQTMERVQPISYSVNDQVATVVNGTAGTNDISMHNTIAHYKKVNGGNEPYKAVYSGFDLSSVPRLNDRVKLIYTVMNWFNWTMKVGNDVAVTKMDITPTDPKYMDEVNITVVVRNNGPFAVNTQVMFYVTGPDNDEEVIPTWGGDDNPVQLTLNPGEERIVSKTWLAITTGLHEFRAMIDPYNLLLETLENNNDLEYSTSEITSSQVSQNILFVDDDAGDTGSMQITRALSALEYQYDIHTVASGVDGPDVDTLKRYNTVIWYCGDATTNTIRANDEVSITNYLIGNYPEASLLGDHNETIWVIGEGIGNSISNGAITDSFYRDVLGLGTKVGGAGSSSSNIIGFQDNAISHGMNYPRLAGGGNNDDLFTPYAFGGVVDHAFGATSPNGGTNFNAIAHQNNDTFYKTFFSGWDVANHDVAGSRWDIKINEVFTGNPDQVEIVNLGMGTIDLTGWSLRCYDGSSGDLYHFPNGFTIGPGVTVVISELTGTNTATRLYDNLNELGIGWTSTSRYYVNLLDDTGASIDYMRRASSGGASYGNPAGVQWTGSAISYTGGSDTTYRNHVGDEHDRLDWTHGGAATHGSLNPGQDLADITNVETGLAEDIYLSLHWLGLKEYKADFRCTDVDITINDDNPQLGNSYVITARVANVGGMDGSCSVRFLDGNTLLKTETPYLESDDFVNLECIWVPLYAGDAANMRSIQVQLDPLDLEDEVFDTYNNYPSNPTEVFFFFDDMEYEDAIDANSAWRHESTVMKINGESSLEYLDYAQTGIVDAFDADTLSGTSWIHNFAVDHSMNSSFSIKEPLATGGINTMLDIMLVLDRSGSMSWGGKWANLVTACNSLIDALDANDRVAIFTFDSRTNAMHTFEFCDAAGKTTLKNFIGAMGTPGGGTNIYSALIEDKSTAGVWNGDFDGETDDDDGAIWYLVENYRATAIPNVITMSDGASAYGDYQNARNAIWTLAGYGGTTNYIDNWRGAHNTFGSFTDIGLYSYSIALGISHDPLCGSTNPIEVRPRTTYSNELMMWTIAQESATGGDLDMWADGDGVYDPGEYEGYGYYYTTDPTELATIFNQISASMGSAGSARSTSNLVVNEEDSEPIAVFEDTEKSSNNGLRELISFEDIRTLSRAELDSRGYDHGVNANYYDYYPTVRYSQYYYTYDQRSTIHTDTTPFWQNFGTGTPISGIDTDYFGVRWTCYIYADYGKTYNFRLYSDDGGMVFIDGQNVIGAAHWRDQGYTSRTGSITLEQGLHQIMLINYQGTSSAQVRLQWDNPGSYQDIPLSNCYDLDNALTDTTLWSQDFNIYGGNTYSYPSWITGYSTSYRRWINSLGLSTYHDMASSYRTYPYNRGGGEGYCAQLMNNGLQGRYDWDYQDAFLENIEVTFEFDWRAVGLESTDRYYLEFYDGSWDLMFTWDTNNDDGAWHNDEQVTIEANYLRYTDFRWRIRESVSATSDYLYIDNIEIKMVKDVEPDAIKEYVWSPNEYGTGPSTGVSWSYTMGYHFTPQVNGQITELGGYFMGTKTVYLWNAGTGAQLATATVTSANNWAYTPITPVDVVAGTRYTVAVWLAGSGGSYRSSVSFPQTYGSVRIDSSCYLSGQGRPTNTVTTSMYGQADVCFEVPNPDALSAPEFPTPQHLAEHVNVHPTLQWYCGPAEKIDYYEIYIDTATPPTVIEDPDNPGAAYQFKGEQYDAGLLQSGTKYYWQVKVVSTSGKEYTSDIWEFTTETIAGEQAGGDDAVEGLNALETDSFTVSGATDVRLEFYHKYNIAGTINGAYLELGVYDGAGDPTDGSNYNWYYIQPEEPYNSNLYLGTASPQPRPNCGPATSAYTVSGDTQILWCWNGKSNNGLFDWEYVSVNLIKQAQSITDNSAHSITLSAQPLKLRFSYFYFGGGVGGGWWVDDVKLIVSADTVVVGSTDVWEWRNDGDSASGTGYWYNGDPADNDYLLGGIDNSLISRPIDLTRAVDARFNAQFAYNVNTDVGLPPDGMRIEVSDDGGLTWTPINYGVRAFSGTSGGVGGPTYVAADTLSRINIDVSAWAGKVILLRFRIVTTDAAGYDHRESALGWGGVYLDDVTIEGISISDVRSEPTIGENIEEPEIMDRIEEELFNEEIEQEQNYDALLAMIAKMKCSDLPQQPSYTYDGCVFIPANMGNLDTLEH